MTGESFIKLMESCGFVDISEIYSDGFDGTLPPYSIARPFQKEIVRYYGVSALIPNLNTSGDFSVPNPVIIHFTKLKEINQ